MFRRVNSTNVQQDRRLTGLGKFLMCSTLRHVAALTSCAGSDSTVLFSGSIYSVVKDSISHHVKGLLNISTNGNEHEGNRSRPNHNL